MNNYLENRRIRGIVYLSALVPLGLLYYMIFSYAVDIPFFDDYYQSLGSVVYFLDSHTLKEKFNVLFSQHNEHRPALARAASIACYYLKGKVDFNLLIYFGNLSLVGLAATLYTLSETGEDRLLYLVPVSFVLFHPQHWENIQWASSVWLISNIVFSLLAIYLVSNRSERHLALSAVFAVAATFTHAMGLFALPVCLFVVVYQKRYRAALLWLLLTAGILIFYFTGYERPGHHPGIWDSFMNPGNTARYFFALLGAPVAVTGKAWLIYALGVASLSAMIWATHKRYYSQNIRIYASLIFLFIVAVVIALSRSGFGVEQAFSSRYRIIPLLIIALECIAVMELLGAEKARRYFPYLLVLTLLFNIGAFLTETKYMKWHRAMLVRGALEYKINGTVPVSEEDREFVKAVIVRAKEMGVYDFPDAEKLMEWAKF